MLSRYSHAFENTEERRFYYIEYTSIQLNTETLLRGRLEAIKHQVRLRWELEWLKFMYPGGGPPKPGGGPGGNPGPGIPGGKPGGRKPGGGPCRPGGPKPKPPGGPNGQLSKTSPTGFSIQRTWRHHSHTTTSRHTAARSDG